MLAAIQDSFRPLVRQENYPQSVNNKPIVANFPADVLGTGVRVAVKEDFSVVRVHTHTTLGQPAKCALPAEGNAIEQSKPLSPPGLHVSLELLENRRFIHVLRKGHQNILHFRVVNHISIHAARGN